MLINRPVRPAIVQLSDAAFRTALHPVEGFAKWDVRSQWETSVLVVHTHILLLNMIRDFLW